MQDSTDRAAAPLVRADGIVKRYANVTALDDVTIAVEDHGNPGMPDLAHQLHHAWG